MFTTATKTIAKIAWRNVTRNWRHSLASSLAILAGFTAVALFDGFICDIIRVNEEGFSLRGMAGHVLIQRKDAQFKLVEDSFAYSMTKAEQDKVDEKLRSDPDFDIRVRFLEVKGMIANGINSVIFIGSSTDVKEGLDMRQKEWAWNTLAGLPLNSVSESDSILIGAGLGRMLGCAADGDTSHVTLLAGGYIPEDRPFKCLRTSLQLSATTEEGQVNALDLKVAGIVDGGFREQDKRWVMLPLPLAQKLLDTNKITTIAVRLKDKDHKAKFISRMKKWAADEGLLLDIMPWEDHQIGALMRGSLSILNSFKSLFMVIVVIICLLSVSNTMMKSVTERIREIGVLRSFGFLQRDITLMFTLEGLFLAAISCAGGVLATLLFSFAVNHSGLTYKAGILSSPIFLTVGLNPIVWLLNTCWLGMLAAGSAWFCARKAAKMVVADAMRHV